MPQWLEITLRTLVAVVTLFVLTKLLGKRQVSQLSVFEYITGITIGSLAAYVSLDLEANWYLGLVSLVVWVAVSLGIEFLQLKSKTMRTIIDGKSTILIKDGKILEDNLKKERITADELLELLRKKNVFRAADVEFAIMETSGEVNVMPKLEHTPLTPSHLGVKVAPEKEPLALIMDGQVLEQPLIALGRDETWLEEELAKLGVTDTKDVYLGQIDSYGKLYVDLMNDQIKVTMPQTEAEALAKLKKCEADLELFSLSTQNKEAKSMYEECSKTLQTIIADLRPYLIR
ncbi:DUF421 domain-containing protein [Paenibacillus apiarius]|uniref:DUF421 domain-containing protein n=1 Tax=Paenibacillus apiarius TaxID=46240 RepID=A0ABT4DYK6_9BACL|nr:DUF421 domain-containing protein [Paenibacillus apiarius]MBN3527194.1 DUF421 domain-containing protein [Paenibacillus apiarius]MCY9514991.1 DUF421 domain-containing protein [Paenibacillus apiarius]MCY9522428.1 DUF421 domain-containing protein [Paenibacillus apiarius]MCY9552152.1 DUF421 domain-containing protein [Paenibacillus apiarius]MCY9561061.1 DUF421 domain-containing protein [Paenibacillus apiarius]